MGTIYWSIVMYINSRQMCALTFAGQRKCGEFRDVVPSAVLCVVLDVQICAVKSKKVSCTKVCYFENCERSGEMRRSESRGVYQSRICNTPRIAESLFRTAT